MRYEFEGLKTSLLKQLEERDHAHSERIQLMEQVNYSILGNTGIFDLIVIIANNEKYPIIKHT